MNKEPRGGPMPSLCRPYELAAATWLMLHDINPDCAPEELSEQLIRVCSALTSDLIMSEARSKHPPLKATIAEILSEKRRAVIRA